METKRIDYKALCEALFEMDAPYEDNFRMLVYTGRKEEERPVFRVAKRCGTTTTTASAWRTGRC